MNKNQTIGEYLAPQVKVMEVMLRQTVLTSSPAYVSNPFGDDNDEEEW